MKSITLNRDELAAAEQGTLRLKLFPYEPLYQSGEILFVKEPWAVMSGHRWDGTVKIQFGSYGMVETNVFDYDRFMEKWDTGKQHSSVHLPYNLARLFFKVKSIYITPLQAISEADAKDCGYSAGSASVSGGPWGVEDDPGEWPAKEALAQQWDESLKIADLEAWGWAANPWVWAIELEPISREEALSL